MRRFGVNAEVRGNNDKLSSEVDRAMSRKQSQEETNKNTINTKDK